MTSYLHYSTSGKDTSCVKEKEKKKKDDCHQCAMVSMSKTILEATSFHTHISQQIQFRRVALYPESFLCCLQPVRDKI